MYTIPLVRVMFRVRLSLYRADGVETRVTELRKDMGMSDTLDYPGSILDVGSDSAKQYARKKYAGSDGLLEVLRLSALNMPITRAKLYRGSSSNIDV